TSPGSATRSSSSARWAVFPTSTISFSNLEHPRRRHRGDGERRVSRAADRLRQPVARLRERNRARHRRSHVALRPGVDHLDGADVVGLRPRRRDAGRGALDARESAPRDTGGGDRGHQPPRCPHDGLRRGVLRGTSISTITLYLAYVIPIYLNWRNRCRRRGEYTEPANAPWSLGRWSAALNVVAILWV